MLTRAGIRARFVPTARGATVSRRPKQKGEIATKVVDALRGDGRASCRLRENEGPLNDALRMTGEAADGDFLCNPVFPQRFLDIRLECLRVSAYAAFARGLKSRIRGVRLLHHR